MPGARGVSCEGGPSLNGSLLAAGLVDEVCVTRSPLLVGGVSARLAVGPEIGPDRFDLAHLLVDAEQFVFARWVRTR